MCGRKFAPSLLARIRARVRSGGDELTRAALSREVCEWMEWRDTTGRLQQMSARVALQRLEKSGHVELPAPRACAARTRARKRWKSPPQPQRVKADLAELGKVRVVEVSAQTTPQLSQDWNQLIGADLIRVCKYPEWVLLFPKWVLELVPPVLLVRCFRRSNCES